MSSDAVRNLVNKLYADVYSSRGRTEIVFRPTGFNLAFFAIIQGLDRIRDEERQVGIAKIELPRENGLANLKVSQIVIWDARFRTGNLAKKITKANVELLRSISTNKESHIYLEAWTGYNTNSGHEYGAYLWAQHGFDFDERSSMMLFEISDWCLKNAISRFKTWLRTTYSDSTHLSNDELLSIEKMADTWKHSWDMATFDIGRPEIGQWNGKLGKEFMTSHDTKTGDFRWHGLLYVNQPDSPGMLQYSKHILGT